MSNNPIMRAFAELNRPKKPRLADQYPVKELERIADQGFVDIGCQCGSQFRLEPNGETTCQCGRHIESPLVTLGYI